MSRLAAMEEKPALVSVLLPVYNGAAVIDGCLRSLRRQRYGHWELLLLDDGSDDGTVDAVRRWQESEPRIRLFADGRRLGIARRLNQGVAAAAGGFIARMDDDDLSFPERFSRQVAFLAAHPEVDLVGGATIHFRDGQPLGRLAVPCSHEEICRRPWNGFPIPHPTWLGRRQWFLANPYDPAAEGVEDQELLLRTHGHSRFACLPEVLLAYRKHQRPLGRCLRTRYRFARVCGRRCLGLGKPGWWAAVWAVTWIKVVLDLVAAGRGKPPAAGGLRPLSTEERAAWTGLWQECVAEPVVATEAGGRQGESRP